MTATELRPDELPPVVAPDPHDVQPTTLSRRHMLAVVCAGGALSAAGPIWLLTNHTATRPQPIGRGRGTWTSYGSVAVLAAARYARSDSAVHLHGASALAGSPLSHEAWSTIVRVDLEVHNGSDRAVLLSPGQFRLRIGAAGTTVAPYDLWRPAGALPPASTLNTWISYLAPADESDLRLEYDDTGLSRPLDFRLSLPQLAATPVVRSPR